MCSDDRGDRHRRQRICRQASRRPFAATAERFAAGGLPWRRGQRYKGGGMSETSGKTGTPTSASLSLWRITAIAASASACLAVLTASQTYLTMLSHGHSFARLLLWQL